MEAFLWTLVVINSLASWGGIRWLLLGKFPARTARDTLADVVIHLVLMMRALSLLFKG